MHPKILSDLKDLTELFERYVTFSVDPARAKTDWSKITRNEFYHGDLLLFGAVWSNALRCSHFDSANSVVCEDSGKVIFVGNRECCSYLETCDT